jgi:hypothetical protein
MNSLPVKDRIDAILRSLLMYCDPKSPDAERVLSLAVEDIEKIINEKKSDE